MSSAVYTAKPIKVENFTCITLVSPVLQCRLPLSMKRFLLLMATGVLFLSTQETQAFIWSFGGEEIAKVADLPNTDEWMTDDGDHADLSVIYQQVWILWIPRKNHSASSSRH